MVTKAKHETAIAEAFADGYRQANEDLTKGADQLAEDLATLGTDLLPYIEDAIVVDYVDVILPESELVSMDGPISLTRHQVGDLMSLALTALMEQSGLCEFALTLPEDEGETLFYQQCNLTVGPDGTVFKVRNFV